MSLCSPLWLVSQSFGLTKTFIFLLSSPWCNIWSSTYKTFSMLLGEVDDNDFKGNQWAVFFFCLYMFGVVIVLANVLIAIVTDSYGVIKNERAGMSH